MGSDSDSESEENNPKEIEKLAIEKVKKEKKEKRQSNPYSFKHWRELLESDSDKGEEEQTSSDSEEDNASGEDGEALFSILDYNDLKARNTDNDNSETPERMMKPPFEKVKKPKEKYMNRIMTKANKSDEIVYQPKDDRWREDIDLGIHDIGMTTIISPKYSFNNDMKYHQEDNDGEQQNDNDEEVHLSDNGCDNYNIKEQNEELVTYNES